MKDVPVLSFGSGLKEQVLDKSFQTSAAAALPHHNESDQEGQTPPEPPFRLETLAPTQSSGGIMCLLMSGTTLTPPGGAGEEEVWASLK